MSASGVLDGEVVGVQTTSGLWLIGSAISGMATCGDYWEEVATSLEESSTLEEDGAPKAFSGCNSPMLGWRCPVLYVTGALGPQQSC